MRTATHVPAAPVRRNSAPPTVVVADDDPFFRELLCECVLASGIRVIPAADAMQAVMYAVRGSASAILLDINMPGGSGLVALERLRKNNRTMPIPVIVVSGSIEPGVEERAHALGARAFLHKPVDPAMLQATLATALAAEDTAH